MKPGATRRINPNSEGHTDASIWIVMVGVLPPGRAKHQKIIAWPCVDAQARVCCPMTSGADMRARLSYSQCALWRAARVRARSLQWRHPARLMGSTVLRRDGQRRPTAYNHTIVYKMGCQRWRMPALRRASADLLRTIRDQSGAPSAAPHGEGVAWAAHSVNLSPPCDGAIRPERFTPLRMEGEWGPGAPA